MTIRPSLALSLVVLLVAACDEGSQAPTPPDVGPELIAVAPFIATAADEFAPAWSPDGSEVAFCRGRANQDLHIHVHSVLDSQTRQISNLSSANECFPSWSPDGAWVVYDDFSNVYISSAAGDSTRLFTQASGQELFAAWSPDSTFIAFSGEVGDLGTPQFDLFVASLRDSTVERVTLNLADDSEPAWSPDANRIAFRSGGVGGNPDVFIHDRRDSTITPVTAHPATDVNPAFSPDGRYLAWTSTRTGNPEIWAIDVETPGAIAVQLTSHGANDNNADWFPDPTGDRALLFSSHRSGNWDIMLATGLDSLLAVSTAGGRPVER